MRYCGWRILSIWLKEKTLCLMDFHFHIHKRVGNIYFPSHIRNSSSNIWLLFTVFPNALIYANLWLFSTVPSMIFFIKYFYMRHNEHRTTYKCTYVYISWQTQESREFRSTPLMSFGFPTVWDFVSRVQSV